MFKNQLVFAWRNLMRAKIYSALNILGLAAGLAVFVLIMLFVRTELRYDRYHANARNIHRVVQVQPDNVYLGSNVFAVTPAPLAAAMVRDFPEVRSATRINNWSDMLVTVGEKSFLQKTVVWTDPQTFEIFSFPFVRGGPASVLKDPSSIVLSERAARRLFGQTDPIGRTLSFQAFYAPKGEFKVAGVFRDLPAESHFPMDVAGSFDAMARFSKTDMTQWNSNSFYTYILLRDGADPKALEAKMPAFAAKYRSTQKPNHPELHAAPRFFFQPLTRIHLHSRANFEMASVGDDRFVLLFASIAVLVLVIAGVNYMNLATARSLKRAKEIGLRKTVGAAKAQIVRQFLGDSLLTTGLALLLALGAVLLALPWFRSFVEREIAFDPLREPALAGGLLLLAAVVGTVAGSYPAFFVSSFRPVAALKGTGGTGVRGRGLRNGLIVFQFAASVALIICAVGVRRQLNFIRTTDMGYEREQIVVLTPRGGLRNNVEAFKTELRRNPAVLAVAASSCLPDNVTSSTSARWPGKPDSTKVPIYVIEADYDFAALYGLKLARGRNFSRDFPSDAGGAFLINEAARKALGWDDPVGRDFNRMGKNDKPSGKIVGVLKDFHMHSLRLPIMPLYVFLDKEARQRISIRIRGGDIPATLGVIQRAWERFSPEYPFEYTFFDEIFDRAYRVDRRLGTMFGVFAGLAVLIACLGLVGLASFTAERKTREIGIRKVLGASSPGVVVLLAREFLRWVVLANVIAWPVGYLAMDGWLRNFAYKAPLTVPMFAASAFSAFAIAAGVIALQTWRAASADPAKSIRCE